MRSNNIKVEYVFIYTRKKVLLCEKSYSFNMRTFNNYHNDNWFIYDLLWKRKVNKFSTYNNNKIIYISPQINL